MKVSFRDIDFSSDTDCETLARWLNQEREVMATRKEIPYSPESIRRDYLGNPNQREGFEAFFICVDATPVGYVTFYLNFSLKLSSESVVWPSIAIGEKSHRRQGLVLKIGEEISRRGRTHGATHVEAGVFTANEPMVKLLKKYGFIEIGTRDVGPHKIPSTHFLRELL